MTTQTNIFNSGCGEDNTKPAQSFNKLYAKFVKVEANVLKYQHLWHRYFKAMHFGHKCELSDRSRAWELQWNDLYDILTKYYSDQFNKEQTKRGVALNYNFGDLLA